MGSVALGIDLGTTNSAVALSRNSAATIIPNKAGENLTPSVVHVNTEEEFVVGEIAKKLSLTDPENSFVLIKRLIGADPIQKDENVSSLLEELKFEVTPGDHRYLIGSPNTSRKLECQEISAQVLSFLYDCGKKYNPSVSKKCVVTVPAYFNNRQRIATKEAVEIAGLELLQLVNEPTAAAIAYGFIGNKKTARKILVADLGGGTFDLSLVEKDSDNMFFVAATLGDSHLGGEDFTQLIANYLIEKACSEYPDILISDPRVITQFYSQAEEAKCQLSFNKFATIDLPFIPLSSGKTCEFSLKLSRQSVESICQPLIERIRKVLQKFKAIDQVVETGIEEIVLVGGSSRLPQFQKIVHKVFGIKPKSDLNPDLLVAQGAAICAELYSKGKPIQSLMCDVTPLTLGIEVIGDEFAQIIPANTSIPCVRKELFTTVYDYQESVQIGAYQGERLIASENILLGSFYLENIEIAEAGVPSFEVCFSIDVDGILVVECIDKITGSNRKIEIADSGNLTPKKIKELKRIAAANRKNDEKLIERNKKLKAAQLEIASFLKLVGRKKIYAQMDNEEENAYVKAQNLNLSETIDFMSSQAFVVLESYLKRSSERGDSLTNGDSKFDLVLAQSDITDFACRAERLCPNAVVTSDYLLEALFDNHTCYNILKSFKIGFTYGLLDEGRRKIAPSYRSINTYKDLTLPFSSLSTESMNLLAISLDLSGKYQRKWEPLFVLMALTCYESLVVLDKEVYDQTDCLAAIILELSAEDMLPALTKAIFKDFSDEST